MHIDNRNDECLSLVLFTTRHLHPQLAEALGVAVQNVGVTTCQEAPREDPYHPLLEPWGCTSGCWASTELGQGFVVVDANVSSVVGPQMTVRRGCGCTASLSLEEPGCAPNTCLNGGRCIPLMGGFRYAYSTTMKVALIFQCILAL